MVSEGHVRDVPAKREKGRESLGPLLPIPLSCLSRAAACSAEESQALRGGLATGKTKPRLESWNAQCCPPSGSILRHADTVMPP